MEESITDSGDISISVLELPGYFWSVIGTENINAPLNDEFWLSYLKRQRWSMDL